MKFWYDQLRNFIFEDDWLEESEIVLDIYDELRGLDDSIEEEKLQQVIIDSYLYLFGNVDYDSRRDFIVAMLYVDQMLETVCITDMKEDEIDDLIQDTQMLYCMSNFLKHQYMTDSVLANIDLVLRNSVRPIVISTEEQELSDNVDDITDHLRLLSAPLCQNEQELEEETQKGLDIYYHLMQGIKETEKNISASEILSHVYHSYTYNFRESKLSYEERYNLILGLILSKYMPNDLISLSEEIISLLRIDDIPNFKKDKYFMYGLLVSKLEDYQINTIPSNNDQITLGIEYSDILENESDIVMNVAMNIEDYYYDQNELEKNSDFILGIIYGTFYKKVDKPEKLLFKTNRYDFTN